MKGYGLEDVKDLIRMALDEDIDGGDVTGRAIFSRDDTSCAMICSKERGIFCGGDMVSYVYGMINGDIMVTLAVADGSSVSPGTVVAQIQGCTADILAGERVVLNFLQRMSGIASRTREIVDMLAGSGITLLDTRKTVPGFRLLDKYSVATGGGKNHRMGLFDMVMIKDNHIDAAGSITRAVEKIRSLHGNTYRVEVETRNLEEVREAVEAGVDVIMFDNMDNEMMRSALSLVGGKARTEISGNIDETKLHNLKSLGVDYISMGALTHSVRAFDLSMKFQKTKR